MQKIKSLDGLRGFSILLVIVGHNLSLVNFLGYQNFLHKYYILHHVGVSLFFTLSGYLITKLLIIEEKKRGNISFKNFYLRRTFRIFPAYYFYIGVMSLLAYWAQYKVNTESIVGALAYTGWYYPLDTELALFGHFWSLSVEEHFYLVFPVLFVIFKKHRIGLISFLILVAPLVRVLNYMLLPAYKAKMGFLTHTRYDVILFGCLMACIEYKDFYQKKVNYFYKKYLYYFPALFIFLINPTLKISLGAKYKYLVAYTLDGLFTCLFISLIMLRSSDQEKSTVFDNKYFCKVGVYSYSIYLWQQPFSTHYMDPFTKYLPYGSNLVLIFILAYASYHLIEMPFLKIKKNFQS